MIILIQKKNLKSISTSIFLTDSAQAITNNLAKIFFTFCSISPITILSEDIIEKYNIVEEDDHINTEGIISNIKVVGIWSRNYWSKCDELLNELKKLTGIKEIKYIRGNII